MKLILETDRLLLRPFAPEDAEAMYTVWCADPEVTRYLTWNPHESLEVTRKVLGGWISEYEKPERLNFAVVLRQTGELMGGIDVVGYLGGVNGTPVIGYVLGRKYWNHGYMTEACRKVLEHLFSLGYPEVRIDAMPENTGSIRVIEKCGGEYIGTEIEELPLKGTQVPVNRYIVRAEQG